MVRHRVAAFVTAACLGALGCDPESAPTDSGCGGEGQTSLDLGTGETAFQALEDGDPLSFYLGPQGGYHVFASLNATGISPGDPTDPFGTDSPRVTLAVAVDGAEVGLLDAQPRAFEPDGAGVARIGERVVLQVPDPTTLDGVAASFSAEVVDVCGRSAVDARQVVLTLAGR